MPARAFLDTNVLIYATIQDDPRGDRARTLLVVEQLTGVELIFSIQMLNEFVSVTRKKLRKEWSETFQALALLDRICPNPLPLTLSIHRRALDVAQRYGYSFYDSLGIAAALEASCSTLYSEDMHDGQQIDGLTIRNPFVQG
jgi:predicted nucleic acid-binding protein